MLPKQSNPFPVNHFIVSSYSIYFLYRLNGISRNASGR